METAVSVLSLVTLVAMLIWGVLVAAAQIACVDAARTAARAAARSEPQTKVLAVARSVAPRGAQATVRRDGEWTRVRITARSFGPAPLVITVRAEAAALAEDAYPVSGAAAAGTREVAAHGVRR